MIFETRDELKRFISEAVGEALEKNGFNEKLISQLNRLSGYSENPYLDSKQTSKMLRVHPTTLLRLTRREGIPCYKVGKQYLFSRADIEVYLQKKQFNNTLMTSG